MNREQIAFRLGSLERGWQAKGVFVTKLSKDLFAWWKTSLRNFMSYIPCIYEKRWRENRI